MEWDRNLSSVDSRTQATPAKPFPGVGQSMAGVARVIKVTLLRSVDSSHCQA